MAADKKTRLSVDKLKLGIYVDLELTWAQHPFLFRQFVIKSANDIQVIKELGLTEVTVIPDRCRTDIPDSDTDRQVAPENNEKLWEKKRRRIDEAANYRYQRQKRSKEYLERVKQIKNLTSNLKHAPANAIKTAREVAELMTETFVSDSDVLINLVNFTDDRFTMHHHTLNVTVLTLSLAKALGIKDLDLHWLCVGAILHDIGKAAVPSKILLKTSSLNISEQKLLNSHPFFGGSLARKLEGVSDKVAEIIEQHHEYIDGSGFPKSLKGDAISPLARIVAITNTYDNLCNPSDAKNALTPKAAMAILYFKHKDQLDSKIVQNFIRCMGVYPPGTIVILSDGSVGLVTGVSSKALLQPQILLYHQDIPRTEALNIDLTHHPELTIKDVMIASECPKRIYAYLGITERTGYYYEQI